MDIESYFDFSEPGYIRLKGHRIGVEDVLYEYLYNELSPSELVQRFPTLNEEKIYATLLYYLRNKLQLDQYLAKWLAHGEQMRLEQKEQPTAAMLRLRAARALRLKTDLQKTEVLQPA